jgi:hypothetical protein
MEVSKIHFTLPRISEFLPLGVITEPQRAEKLMPGSGVAWWILKIRSCRGRSA